MAHDWGGAVAWGLANQQPHLMQRLAILNSPHPGTFLRALQASEAQQQASAYMNFLVRPDAEVLLREDDYRRLFGFFTHWGPATWLTGALKAKYRAVWDASLTGGLNYYRASPLRPPTDSDSAILKLELSPEQVTVRVPTLVIWAEDDIALPVSLLDGLESWVPSMRVVRVPQATHWILHERPGLIAGEIERVLAD